MGWRVDSELQQMLRESAKGYLAAESGPAHFRRVRATNQGFDANAWKALADLGWTGILLPESAGGSELGLGAALTLAEEFGQALTPEPFVASAIIAGTLLARATGESGARLAQALAVGDKSVTLAWQEQRGVIGTATLEAALSNGQLSGRKVCVPAWHDATELLVAVRDGDGMAIVHVDPKAAGVTIEAQRMTDGSTTATLQFNAVKVSSDAIILRGGAAQAALDLALANGTLALAAQLEGLATAMWRRTADYLKQRVQFDQPIADFQAIRHRMVDLYGGIELAGASWRAALSALERDDTNSLSLHAAKARCSAIAMEMGRWAVQYHGAFGYTEEADVGLYLNCAMTWSSWLGNANAHRRRGLAIHETRIAKND